MKTPTQIANPLNSISTFAMPDDTKATELLSHFGVDIPIVLSILATDFYPVSGRGLSDVLVSAVYEHLIDVVEHRYPEFSQREMMRLVSRRIRNEYNSKSKSRLDKAGSPATKPVQGRLWPYEILKELGLEDRPANANVACSAFEAFIENLELGGI